MKQPAILNTSYFFNPVCQYMSFCERLRGFFTKISRYIFAILCAWFGFIFYVLLLPICGSRNFTKTENYHLNMMI